MSETPVESQIRPEDSILASVKKGLGIHDGYTDFDLDVMMHINSTFPILAQLGIGPVGGYEIVDREDAWVDYLGVDPNLNSVKTYITLRVRMVFDPPGTSFHINAMEEQIKELEWRLNTHREVTTWQPSESL